MGPAASRAGELGDGVRERVGGDDARGQPQLQRLLGAQGPGEVEQLERLRPADEALEGPARAGVAGERHAREGEVEAGGVGQHAQVAGEGQARPRAGGDAVDGGDDGLGHRGDRLDDRVVVLLDGVEERVLVAALQQADVLLEVLAHAEGAPASGEHQAPRGVVGGDGADGVEQGLLGGDVEAVHRVGTVEGDGRDTVGDVEQHRVLGGGHGVTVEGGDPALGRVCGRDHPVHRG